MLWKYRRLNEASFRSEKIIEVCRKYGKLLGKPLGRPFKVWTAETFSRPGESGTGVRMAALTGHMIRLNFSSLRADSLTLSSLDYWTPHNRNLEKPTCTCKFYQDMNVIGIWKALSGLIFNLEYGKYTLGDLYGLNEDLQKGSIKARKAFLASKGIPQWLGASPKNFEPEIAKRGLEDEWNNYILGIMPGRTETNSTAEKMAEAEKIEKKVKDPDEIFRDLNTLIGLMLKGSRKMLTVCGSGGMGKSYEVKKALTDLLGEPPNDRWVYISAPKISPRQFYEEVYRSRDKVICFDEADNILTNDEIVTMLKPGLDTTGDNEFTYNTMTKRMTDYPNKDVREYCHRCDELLDMGYQFVVNRRFGKDENVFGSNDFNDKEEPTGVWMPSKFFFDGKMIFISNLPIEKIDRALLTRGPRVNTEFDIQGKIKRISTVMRRIGYGEDLISTMQRTFENESDPNVISIRTAIGFIEYAKTGDVNSAEALRLAANYG